jgi:hypothetical protein
MHPFLTLFIGFMVGLIVGAVMILMVMRHTIQRHFLIQGMNWDAVDRHTELILARAPNLFELIKVSREERASRAKWETYKNNNPDWKKPKDSP